MDKIKRSQTTGEIFIAWFAMVKLLLLDFAAVQQQQQQQRR